MFIINKALPVTNPTFNCIAAKISHPKSTGEKKKGITEKKKELTLGVM